MLRGFSYSINDILFATAFQLGLDFDDAPTAAQSGFPSSYPTTLADLGARHLATGPTLGANRDVESDGRPNPAAAATCEPAAPTSTPSSPSRSRQGKNPRSTRAGG
jgi:hypothetical protein